jgi:deazaflavin-dependent oxidoreductase (nitroreductase family)
MNRVVGFLAAQGVLPGYCHELSVVGRKSGNVYTTPVNLLDYEGKLWLVGARGRMQWTRNAEAAGEIVLRRGKKRVTYVVRTAALAERAPVLKRYLETWPSQVQSFFSVRAGAPVDEFTAIADQHPVYELIPKPAA